VVGGMASRQQWVRVQVDSGGESQSPDMPGGLSYEEAMAPPPPISGRQSGSVGEVGDAKKGDEKEKKGKDSKEKGKSGGGVAKKSQREMDKEHDKRLARVVLHDEKLKETGIVYSPIDFQKSDKRLLRDNMTSVNRRDIQPKFIRLSNTKLKSGSYLRAAIRLVYQSHAYKVKRISFDRLISHSGLLFFIDGLERDGDASFHIWLYIRLVTVNEDVAEIRPVRELKRPDPKAGSKSPRVESPQSITVHDIGCKRCKRRQECSHEYKAVEQLTEYTFGVNIKFPVRLPESPVYLYVITLNSPKQAALSPALEFRSRRIDLTKKVEKKKKTKKTKKTKTPRTATVGAPSSPHQESFADTTDNDTTDLYTDCATEPMTEANIDLDDEEGFFEKSYNQFDSPKAAAGRSPRVPGRRGTSRSPNPDRSGPSSGRSTSTPSGLRPSPRPARSSDPASPVTLLDALRGGNVSPKPGKRR